TGSRHPSPAASPAAAGRWCTPGARSNSPRPHHGRPAPPAAPATRRQPARGPWRRSRYPSGRHPPQQALTPREDNQTTPVRLAYRSQSTALIPRRGRGRRDNGPVAAAVVTVGDRRSGLTRAPEPRNSSRSRQAGADHEGLTAGTDFDTDLLFYTCVLHYLGTSPSGPPASRAARSKALTSPPGSQPGTPMVHARRHRFWERQPWAIP